MLFYYAECHCAECRILFTIMQNVIMLSVVMLNVIMLSIVMLSAVVLSIVAPILGLVFQTFSNGFSKWIQTLEHRIIADCSVNCATPVRPVFKLDGPFPNKFQQQDPCWFNS